MILAEIDNELVPSQSSRVYSAIRSKILSGNYAPGTKLKIQDFAKKFDVSPGAVREALSRLVPEGLVITREQRGFEVSPLSLDDLQDLTDLRCAIESVALRRSLQNGDASWESRVVAAAHKLKTLSQATSVETKTTYPAQAWIDAHAEFHLSLVSACGSPRLLTLHTQLYEQSERYRNRTAYQQAKRPIADEHEEMLGLALSRRVEGLIEAMELHIRRTTSVIIHAEEDAKGATS